MRSFAILLFGMLGGLSVSADPMKFTLDCENRFFYGNVAVSGSIDVDGVDSEARESHSFSVSGKVAVKITDPKDNQKVIYEAKGDVDDSSNKSLYQRSSLMTVFNLKFSENSKKLTSLHFVVNSFNLQEGTGWLLIQNEGLRANNPPQVIICSAHPVK